MKDTSTELIMYYPLINASTLNCIFVEIVFPFVNKEFPREISHVN